MHENPQGFQKFKKMPLILSILFMVSSFFVLFFLYGQINNNKKISEQIQAEWQTEKIRRNEARSLDRLVLAIGKEKILLESHFTQSSNIVPLLNTIEQLSLKVGAKSKVTSVDISKDKTILMVAVGTSGSFNAVYKFLMLLENSPYELEFVSVDMQKTGAPTVSGKIIVSPQWEAIFKIKLLSFVQ